MRNRLKNINFYLTSLAIGSGIDNLVDSGTFTVKDTTVNGFSLTNGDQVFFVIVDADDTLKREIFRITNVNIATKVLTFDKRISPNGKQTHNENALVQINDFAELFNYLSLHLDDAGYTEIISGRDVKFAGGIFRYGDSNVSISDGTYTMNPNATNYLILDFTDGLVKVVTDLTGLQYFLFCTAVTDGSNILSLTDNRANFVGFDTSLITPTISVGNTTTLDSGASATVVNSGTSLEPVFNFGIPKGEKGDIGDPGPAGQTITDNIVSEIGTTVTTDNTTFIKVVYSNGIYTLYELDGWNDYDENNNSLGTKDVYIGSFGTDGITYSNGNFVNKITGVITYTGKPAYRDQQNIFSKRNTFDNDVLFKGRVSFPYAPMTLNGTDILFDGDKGTKQYINIGAGAYTLSFTNLRSGCNYEFAIIASGTATLSKGTITNSDTITSFYSINNSITNGMTLSPDVHLFVCDTFSTAVHISYLGYSRGF